MGIVSEKQKTHTFRRNHARPLSACLSGVDHTAPEAALVLGMGQQRGVCGGVGGAQPNSLGRPHVTWGALMQPGAPSCEEQGQAQTRKERVHGRSRAISSHSTRVLEQNLNLNLTFQVILKE